MILQPEYRRTLIRCISPDTFKNAQSVMQRMGQHVYLGFSPGHQLTIKPNHTISISEIRTHHRNLKYSSRVFYTLAAEHVRYLFSTGKRRDTEHFVHRRQASRYFARAAQAKSSHPLFHRRQAKFPDLGIFSHDRFH